MSNPGPGHNSSDSHKRLQSIVDRIERLEEEKAALGQDIKDVYSEAKSAGFDVKVLRLLIRDRKQDQVAVQDREALLEVYKHALGMLADLPLGAAAMERA